jgi:hypothetical protein
MHDVPEDRVVADGDHRLRAKFGFFFYTGAQSSAKNKYWDFMIAIHESTDGIILIDVRGNSNGRPCFLQAVVIARSDLTNY